MPDVSQELIQIVCTKRHVAFAQDDKLRIFVCQCFLKTAVHTRAIALFRFVVNNRPSTYGTFERLICTIVVNDNNSTNERMLNEVFDRKGNARFVVICRQDYGQARGNPQFPNGRRVKRRFAGKKRPRSKTISRIPIVVGIPLSQSNSSMSGTNSPLCNRSSRMIDVATAMQ